MKMDQNIAKTNIMNDFENILFCKTSKNQRVAKISQVGEFTLRLVIFLLPQIFICVAHNKQYMKTIYLKGNVL